MPVRSLSSSVFKWPEARSVDQAIRQWAAGVTANRPGICRIGYFGSYARGDWGVGSDLDILIVVEHCEQPFEKRAAQWPTSDLPVPADVWVYTEQEWRSFAGERFHRTVQQEAVWVFEHGRLDRP